MQGKLGKEKGEINEYRKIKRQHYENNIYMTYQSLLPIKQCTLNKKLNKLKRLDKSYIVKTLALHR